MYYCHRVEGELLSYGSSSGSMVFKFKVLSSSTHGMTASLNKGPNADPSQLYALWDPKEVETDIWETPALKARCVGRGSSKGYCRVGFRF